MMVRPAKSEDATAVAVLVDSAAGGMFKAMVGDLSVLAEASLTPGHQLSLEHAVVAVDGDQLLGAASAMTGVEARADSSQALAAAAGWRSVRMMVVSGLFRPILRFMDRHHDDEFYLMAIAVKPEARNSGVGSLLLADVEQRAAAAGSAHIALDVDANNSDAKRLYSRKGFRQVAVSSRAWLGGGAQVERWARPLAASDD
ncbi:MAG: GNAT family N-acetyltransferase [Actinomycetia bacterium]|nr:GNAT family N-acetyltransferase [Actinomycetes bacterium]MCH9801071.1 GNAT family N-acetyltransferase [Actinomycetes bacterium]